MWADYDMLCTSLDLAVCDYCIVEAWQLYLWPDLIASHLFAAMR